jgi:hypothetical protein
MALAVAGLGLTGLAASASAGTKAATEHILLLQTSVTGSPTVIANGPIHARGRDVVVSNTKDRFVFPRGSVTVVHHATPGSSRSSFDPVTCLTRQSERGTYRVTHGTGAYDDATGSGRYRSSVFAVGCSQTRKPSVFIVKVSASGPLSL